MTTLGTASQSIRTAFHELTELKMTHGVGSARLFKVMREQRAAEALRDEIAEELKPRSLFLTPSIVAAFCAAVASTQETKLLRLFVHNSRKNRSALHFRPEAVPLEATHLRPEKMISGVRDFEGEDSSVPIVFVPNYRSALLVACKTLGSFGKSDHVEESAALLRLGFEVAKAGRQDVFDPEYNKVHSSLFEFAKEHFKEKAIRNWKDTLEGSLDIPFDEVKRGERSEFSFDRTESRIISLTKALEKGVSPSEATHLYDYLAEYKRGLHEYTLGYRDVGRRVALGYIMTSIEGNSGAAPSEVVDSAVERARRLLVESQARIMSFERMGGLLPVSRDMLKGEVNKEKAISSKWQYVLRCLLEERKWLIAML